MTAQDEPGGQVGQRDAQGAGEPYQCGQRRLEVHPLGIPEARAAPGRVDPVSGPGGQDHRGAHREDPHQQHRLEPGIRDCQQYEGDQGDAGDAIGLEAVGAGAHRVARVVAGAVRDDAGIARVVLVDLEDDLHQIGADVGDLGEDAAGDAQGRCPERLADGEADEAGAGHIGGQEQQDHQHHQQFETDEHHADAHARSKRYPVHLMRLAAQGGEGGPGVGEGVDPDSEPRHAV